MPVLYACRPLPLLSPSYRVISALVVSSDPAGAAALSADLSGVGIHTLGAVGCDALVREAVRQAPDVVVCWEPTPADALFRAIETLAATTPQPVVLFTLDADVARIERALRAGIHEVVVNGHAAARLRSVLQTAIARFRHERELRDALADLTHRYEERKLVDRAKGLLMRVREVPEDEAFRLLRTAAMQHNLRLGQVAQQVIDGARSAESLNRAGQLRMLSQRIVKLQALQACGDGDAADASRRLASSIERVEQTLALLERQLSGATFGDLLAAVAGPWRELKPLLQAGAAREALAGIDALAERLLAAAERLTAALEAAGGKPTLAVINLCGRQRMLSQRLAKQALLGALLGGEAAAQAQAAARETMEAFEAAMKRLREAPLSSDEIRAALDASTEAWHELLSGAAQAAGTAGREALARSSEALLELFETLTERYERSMQVLMG
jgi:two-component system, response regulator PdtaR